MLSMGASETIQVFSEPFIILLFNSFPIFWFRIFILKYGSMLPFKVEKTELENLYNNQSVSKREQEIIELIIDGKKDKEIADILFIAYHTVKNHKYRIYKKLGVKSKFELLNLILGRK